MFTSQLYFVAAPAGGCKASAGIAVACVESALQRLLYCQGPFMQMDCLLRLRLLSQRMGPQPCVPGGHARQLPCNMRCS